MNNKIGVSTLECGDLSACLEEGKNSVVNITECALNKMCELLFSVQGSQDTVLRIISDKGGCKGIKFDIELNDFLDNKDIVLPYQFKKNNMVIVDKIRAIVVERRSLIHAVGMTIDYISSEIERKFVFIHSEYDACGCGESFDASN